MYNINKCHSEMTPNAYARRAPEATATEDNFK